MKKGEHDKERLVHILDAIDFILIYTKDKSEDDFYRDMVLKYATLKQIEIIGEAANFLSEALKEKYNKIEWNKIISARNIYVHQYFHVNWLVVWEIIQEDILPLKEKIENILNDL